MAMTDPVADYLTRIRNGLLTKKKSVLVPESRLKAGISKVLQQEGFINGFSKVEGETGSNIEIELKYGSRGSVITEIARVSRPGCRIYHKKKDIPVFKNGVGIYILTTPQGVMSDRAARKANVGGEVLCSVW